MSTNEKIELKDKYSNKIGLELLLIKYLGEKHYKLKFIMLIVQIFIFIHLACFAGVFIKTAKSGLFVRAKAYMAAAETVNILYLQPLFKFTKFNSKYQEPFKKLRDYFYAQGVSHYPVDEGEKEIWWFTIYFSDYENSVEKAIYDYSIEFGRKKKKYFPEDEIQIMFDRTDELYQRAKRLAKAKITDKNFREKRLNMYIAMAFTYLIDRDILYSEYYLKEKFKFLKSEEEINKIAELFDIYDDLKEYCLKNENESYEFFFYKTHRSIEDYRYRYNSAKKIIRHRLILDKKIYCDANYINQLGETFEILYKKYAHIPSKHSFVRKIVLFTCPQNRKLNFLRNHTINSYKRSKALVDGDNKLKMDIILNDINKVIERWRQDYGNKR